MHRAFLAFPIVSVTVCAVMGLASSFDGFVGADGFPAAWMGAIFALMTAAQLVVVFVFIRSERYLNNAFGNWGEGVDGATAAGLLLGALFERDLRSINVAGSITIYGVILFLYSGDFGVTVPFSVVSLGALLLVTPHKADWESAFQMAKGRFPNLPNDPWQPRLA